MQNKSKKSVCTSIIMSIKSGSYNSEIERDGLIDDLERVSLNPYVIKFFREKKYSSLTAEEIADLVLSYKPIILPPPSK